MEVFPTKKHYRGEGWAAGWEEYFPSTGCPSPQYSMDPLGGLEIATKYHFGGKIVFSHCPQRPSKFILLGQKFVFLEKNCFFQ